MTLRYMSQAKNFIIKKSAKNKYIWIYIDLITLNTTVCTGHPVYSLNNTVCAGHPVYCYRWREMFV